VSGGLEVALVSTKRSVLGFTKKYQSDDSRLLRAFEDVFEAIARKSKSRVDTGEEDR
jgi:hypothetical protein